MGKIERTSRARGKPTLEAKIEMSTAGAQAMEDGNSAKDGNDQVESSGLGEETIEARIEMSTPRAQAMDDGDSVKGCNDQVESPTKSGKDVDNFTLKVHYGGVYVKEPKQAYVGGSVETFEGVIAKRLSKSILRHFCTFVGCPEDSKMMYGIPDEKNVLKLRQIDSEDAAIDVACIGKQYGEVDVYGVYEFHIRDVNSNTDLGAATVEEIKLKDDNLYVGLAFDDIDLADFEEIPVKIEQMMEHVKSKYEKTELAEHGGNDGDDDAVHSDSSRAESFHDSDYNFDHDEEDVIFQSCVVTPEQELGCRIGKIQPDHGAKRRGNECKKQKMSTATVEKKKDRAKDRSLKDLDLHLDEGDQIPVHEESDSLASDELKSCQSSSDEDSKKAKNPNLVRFKPDVDMEDPKFHVGQIFDNKQLFKLAVDNYAVKWGKDIQWIKQDATRMRVKCKAENCKWMLFASKVDVGDDSLVMKTMGPEHNCGRTFYHKRATSGFLAKKYAEFLRLNKRITVEEFKEKVHSKLNVHITIAQVYKTFMKAKIIIHGSYKEQYKRLWDYCDELLKSNPGSTVYMETELDEDIGRERFQRLYVCFGAIKRGYKSACKPVIGVDGSHLRGPHPGVLLTAVGIDPNDCLYPVAYAVVEAENKKSWKWFVEFLKYDLKIYDQRKWTLISDRQKGLGTAIHEVLPEIEHRHCVRHLHNNFKKCHPGLALKERFWTCARSSYMTRFENQMESLKEYDEKAWNWLTENTSPCHWSRSHFRTAPKCDILLNNLCESFNSVIMEAREKPILGMLETLRIYLMERLRTKREWMKKRKDKICPKIQKKLEKAKTETASNIARWSKEDQFEVTHVYGGKYVVDLKKQTCTCRRWDLTGWPCCHAICCISLTGVTPESMVHQYYTRENYLKAYEPAIAPMSGPNAWVQSKKEPVLPPTKLKLLGRPRKARKREPDEPRANSVGVTKLPRSGLVKIKCSNCHLKGHTVRKCPLIIPVNELPGSCSGRPPSSNSNKCSFCKEKGHNKRTCPQLSKTTERPEVNEDHGSTTSADVYRAFNDSESGRDQQKPATVSSSNNVPGEITDAGTKDAEVIKFQLSAPQAISTDLPEKVMKCSVCKKTGHNRQTCDSFQTRSWRKRRATMSVYGPFPPSKGKGTRRKQMAHRVLDEDDDEADIAILEG